MQGLLLRGRVRDAHDPDQRSRREAREEPQEKQRAAHEFGRGGHDRIQVGGRDAKAREILGDSVQVVQLAPAGAHEMPAPEEADDQQDGALKQVPDRCEERVELGQDFHGESLRQRVAPLRFKRRAPAVYSRGRKTTRAPSRS